MRLTGMEIGDLEIVVGMELAIGESQRALTLPASYIKGVCGTVTSIGPTSFKLSTGHRVSNRGTVYGEPDWRLFPADEFRTVNRQYRALVKLDKARSAVVSQVEAKVAQMDMKALDELMAYLSQLP